MDGPGAAESGFTPLSPVATSCPPCPNFRRSPGSLPAGSGAHALMPAVSLLPAASPCSRRWLATFAAYTGAVALCVGILVWVLRLDQANLRIPFPYNGDALSIQMSIKGLVENGWYLHNDRLGAPMGADLHGYPRADDLHYLLIKLLSLRTSNFAILYNLYFLLTFPLTTFSSLFVLRHFKV